MLIHIEFKRIIADYVTRCVSRSIFVKILFCQRTFGNCIRGESMVLFLNLKSFFKSDKLLSAVFSVMMVVCLVGALFGINYV